MGKTGVPIAESASGSAKFQFADSRAFGPRLRTDCELEFRNTAEDGSSLNHRRLQYLIDMRHPAIGKLYSLRLSSKLLVHISPVEIIKEGFYNGSVICYIFNPELTAEYLYSSGSNQDLFLPAFITYPQYFSKRYVTYIESDDVLELPYFTQHVFRSVGSDTIWDANGNRMESISEGSALFIERAQIHFWNLQASW